nr:DUF2712 domain-containing protein [Fredinandcohnia onubensis]
MKNFAKKFSKVGLAAVMGVGILATANFTYASNDNIGFSFSLKPYHGNTYTDSRYRQTTNTKNQWKVNYAYSSEGKGTVATFWLDKSGTRVSDTNNITQGTTEYTDAFSTASQSYVRLGAENNNYSANSYSISGYWDEETK